MIAVIIAVLSVNMVSQETEELDAALILIAALNTLWYPYSRFLYSWLVTAVMGEYRMHLPGKWVVLRWVYVVTVAVMLWSVSVFLAPVGILLLYFVNRHGKGKTAGYDP